MPANGTFLSIVIPSYNEEVNIRKGALSQVHDFLSRQSFSYEVIVVDDGSTDKSRQLVEEFMRDHGHIRQLCANHGGKANAIIEGVKDAKGEIVLFTDMDQATPLKEMLKLLQKFEEGYDVAIGSRGTVREGAPLTRRLTAIGMIVIRKLILGLVNISDTQTGFKAFRRDVALKIFDRLTLFGKGAGNVKGAAVTASFDVEVLFIGEKLQVKIAEVPVEWHHIETRHVNPVVEGIRTIKDLLTIRLNDLRGRYAP